MKEDNSALKIMVLIPARGGSKGVPRKAIRMLGDMPLIAYTIRDALAIEGVTKVFVSTDDPEIRRIAVLYGAEVPFLRPAELARDDSRLEDAIEYSMTWYLEKEGFAPDIQIIMSPTHPFRRPQLINDALRFSLHNQHVFNIGSVAPWGGDVNQYWCDCGEGEGWRRYFNGKQTTPARLCQSAFSFNIVFLSRPHLPPGRVPVFLNDIESIDIDEPKDLMLARLVVSEGLYPFNESF